MPSTHKKDAKDFIPFCEDQGMPNLVATKNPGVSLQSLEFEMVTGGVVNFEAQGLGKMASASYQVLVQNQTDPADEATVGSKTAAGFVITGPDNADVLDIVIVGTLAGQKS